MSQHQNTFASKTTKSTQKVSAPSMDIPDDEILDVVPLSVIPCEALDLIHPMDASASACPNPGYSMKGVSTPLSKMYPSPEVEQHSEKNDDPFSSEKDMAAEGSCSLGKTVSDKGKFVASKTANASHSEKHDDANEVIDLKDDRSDDQEDNLLHHLKPSVAKRMKTRKGRSVAELMLARKAKKTAGIGPSKSWSKVEVKKRKIREDSESAEDVEEDVSNISPVKKTTMRKSPVKCYEGLVMEFIVNIPEDIADKNNKEFCKVFVRGKCIKFSPTVINNFLGRKIEGASELEATDNEEAEAHTCSERSANNEETSGNYVSGADEAASSSSTD
ncbi:uncharacterized protein LOC127123504 [Lathyrus oleraceus]|uniref:uncharacterized protein LOC127123504 n=1 Tax=Pisum sativum TaxID=3888 RepID=UPI0021CE30AE|nr:uncharacterized protein LOC127123504 [Pisum sativum]